MSIVDPAANHVEEMDGHGEVQALFAPPYEEPQAKSACERI